MKPLAQRTRLGRLLAAPMFALLGTTLIVGCASAPERILNAASPYFEAKTLDLSRVLPPPPTNDSATTRAEIALMLKVQQERTPEEAALARADVSYSVFRFADALGTPEVFNARSLPKRARSSAR